MRNSFFSPTDTLAPIDAALRAAQHLLNDEHGRDLAHELIAWAQGTAQRAVEAVYADADNQNESAQHD